MPRTSDSASAWWLVPWAIFLRRGLGRAAPGGRAADVAAQADGRRGRARPAAHRAAGRSGQVVLAFGQAGD
eukprot:4701138-Alexandrium_andersonii.AAC.1